MPVEHVQTKREIQSTLLAAGVRPRRRFGQHFLIDGNLMRRLAAAAELSENDVVLEVGAGTGGLTDGLVAMADHVIAVEIDPTLMAILEDRFHDDNRVTLIAGDVLAGKHRLNPAVVDRIQALTDWRGGDVHLVANLPYQVATPLLMNLLIDYPIVRRFVFTVQKEVADRIASAPDRRSYGPLSILCQSLTHVTTVAEVSPQSFWPAPAVESAMLRLDVVDPPFPDRDALRRFASLVRRSFEHRRKTLRSALRYVVDESAGARVEVVVDATRRPESFTLAEWFELFAAVDAPSAFTDTA